MSIEKFRATYRLQLHKDFTLVDASNIMPYLEELGVSHLYLSPILESQSGSNHGYDGLDPTKISVERGGELAFDQLAKKVKESEVIHGMILDIVPNHLAATETNPAWWDVLKKGPQSDFWNFFDLRSQRSKNFKVTLPVLDRSQKSVLNSRGIQIGILKNELVFLNGQSSFPISLDSYEKILKAIVKNLPVKASVFEELENILQKKEIAEALRKSLEKKVLNAVELKKLFASLPLKLIADVLDDQHFVLKDWQSGSAEINYRRFFDINGLVAVRVEDKEVHEWSHAKIKTLLGRHSVIDGLRVDHIDGLTFPELYLKRLSKLSRYVWIEKILGPGETVPVEWKTVGTTGYEFSNITSRLFVSVSGLLDLHSHYVQDIDTRWERFHDCVYESKREMLDHNFKSELNYLAIDLHRIARDEDGVVFSVEDLKEVIAEVTSSLKIYRTYLKKNEGLSSVWLNEALQEAEGRGEYNSEKAFKWFRSALLKSKHRSQDLYLNLKRWEQLSGPVMAKGLEDTALYRYCPLLSLNGVGGEPDWTGDGVTEFHTFNQERLRDYPLAMNSTCTHDSKRSEDVRSRIHVLSELPNTWIKLFESWRRLQPKEGLDIRTKYLIYETLVGAWPFEGKITPDFAERMQQYFLKASREAKMETSWTDPNEHYEKILHDFIQDILFSNEEKSRRLREGIRNFAEICMFYGAFNSLSLLALKMLSPGMPDFYQGCDLWDLSLVDPDNRRPVNYELRARLLKKMKRELKSDPTAFRKNILNRWKTGEVKLWLTWCLLHLRRQNPLLFTEGDYHVVTGEGSLHRHFISFCRHRKGRWVLVVVPRHVSEVEKPDGALRLTNKSLLQTVFHLPKDAPQTWVNALNGETLAGSSLRVAELFAGLPVVVLTA